mgnify:CR=1 FL=1
MGLRLREAHAGDTGTLTDILHRAKSHWGYGSTKMEAFRTEYRISQATLNAQNVLVAADNGRPVGFAGGYSQSDCLYIEFLFVAPEVIGKGLGSLLLQRMTDRARSAGKSRLLLESDHHARGFYEANGFEVLSERPSQMSPSGVIPLMEKQLVPSVHRIDDVVLQVETGKVWEFEVRRQSEIDIHWGNACRQNPNLWNGRTLKLVDFTLEDGRFSGTCHECSFSAFLAWRDWGAPDLATWNAFGSAVLRSSDGALLFGVMSEKTANSGKVYPPGGNLDPEDVNEDGHVDIVRAIYRELEEETGLTPSDGTAGPMYVVLDGPRISFALVIDLPVEANALREKILSHSVSSQEQELSDVRILRSGEDLMTPDIVPYARDIGTALLCAS